MENASKALLIAAAVLIVVLLIAFGMGVFKTSKEAGDSAQTANQIQVGIGQAGNSINSSISSITTGLNY